MAGHPGGATRPSVGTVHRLEFTIEPFDEGRPGPHVTEPAAVLRAAGYDVDFGPFGSSVSVPTGDVGTVAALVLTTAFGHGATHVNLDVGAPQ